MQYVKAEIREEYREEAVKGKEPICLEWLEQVIIQDVHRISGNRCDFKLVLYLGHYLFDFDNGRARPH